METIAGISGATLGYIYNNLPGAYYGYKLGKGVYKRMAPIRRSKYGYRRGLRSGKWKVKKNYPSTQGRYVKKRLGSNNVTTKQYDVTTQYRKSYMPKRRKRAWKGFVKKVTAVQIKNAGLKTVLFNKKLVQSTTAGFQNVMWLGLYGNFGSDDSNDLAGWGDIKKIFYNDPSIIKTGTAPNEFLAGGKLVFGSAVMDITVRNLAEQDAEVDIYHFTFNKNQDQLATATDNPGSYFGNQPVVIKTGNTSLNIGDRGCTFFDLSASLSATGMKIIRKQKMVLEPGKSAFIQHRDAGNHSLDVGQVKNVGFALRKVTYGIAIVHKPSVAVADNLISTLAVGVTRKYSYVAIDENTDCVAKL